MSGLGHQNKWHIIAWFYGNLYRFNGVIFASLISVCYVLSIISWCDYGLRCSRVHEPQWRWPHFSLESQWWIQTLSFHISDIRMLIWGTWAALIDYLTLAAQWTSKFPSYPFGERPFTLKWMEQIEIQTVRERERKTERDRDGEREK